MRKNDFCVNDKVVGSCWGTVTTFEELDAKKKDDSLGEVKFIQILNEWNGNVVEKTKVEEDGTKVVGWEREERELTLDEYQQMKLVQEVVNTNKSEIVSSVTDFQKSAVIDEYTLQLVEEGLL